MTGRGPQGSPRVRSPAPGASVAASLVHALRDAGQTLAVAESCTGGLVADMLTDVPGASRVLKAALVCYRDEAKRRLLGVPSDVLRAHGAVSERVVRAMAEGARARLRADWGLATSGLAGPGGGGEGRPVGTLHVAVAGPADTVAFHELLAGLDRRAFKRAAALAALGRLVERATPSRPGPADRP